MSELAPEGPFSIAVDAVRDLLSLCPSWQEWTRQGAPAGTTQEKIDRARGRTYAIDLPAPEGGQDRRYEVAELKQVRPFCIVDHNSDPKSTADWPLQMVKVAEMMYVERHTLLMVFEDNVAEVDQQDPRTAQRRFMNFVGRVIVELTERSGIDGRINLSEFRVAGGPYRTSEEDVATEGDRFVLFILATATS